MSSDPEDPTKPATDYCIQQADVLARTAETINGVEQKLCAAIFSLVGMVAMVLTNLIYISKYQWENGIGCQYFLSTPKLEAIDKRSIPRMRLEFARLMKLTKSILTVCWKPSIQGILQISTKL